MIILDNRENKLIDIIGDKFKYTTENLHLGDIILKHKIHDKMYSIIIERKIISDMVASIKDGRYKEQKMRLLAEAEQSPETIICYILEGMQLDLNQKEQTMLNGAVLSTQFRDKIPIIRTYTIQETLDMIARLHDRLLANDLELFGTTTNTNYLHAVKKCKKDNLTPQLWNQICYTNIPGISSTIASKIAEKYPTIQSLLNTYNNCSTTKECELLLAKITISDKRKLGNVISKRVYQYIMDDMDDIQK